MQTARVSPQPGAARPLIFSEVYREHVDLVWRTLRRSGVRPENLDDVAQEVFLSIHKNLSEFEYRSSVRTWVYRIARNTSLNHQRALGRRPDAPFVCEPDEKQHSAPGPEDQASRNEALRELNEVISTLDERKREVLVLVDLEGFSSVEVAETLDLPVNTVSSRLRLARKDFNDALKRRRTQTRFGS